MVGAHVHVSNIGNGVGRMGIKGSPQWELYWFWGCQVSAHSSFFRASLLAPVSHPGRNHFQQSGRDEGDPRLCLMTLRKSRDGKREHRGTARGSALPGGGVGKNGNGGWFCACNSDLKDPLSLLQGCPWKHFRGCQASSEVAHGFQPSHGEERERGEPEGFVVSMLVVCTPRIWVVD